MWKGEGGGRWILEKVKQKICLLEIDVRASDLYVRVSLLSIVQLSSAYCFFHSVSSISTEPLPRFLWLPVTVWSSYPSPPMVGSMLSPPAPAPYSWPECSDSCQRMQLYKRTSDVRAHAHTLNTPSDIKRQKCLQMCPSLPSAMQNARAAHPKTVAFIPKAHITTNTQW